MPLKLLLILFTFFFNSQYDINLNFISTAELIEVPETPEEPLGMIIPDPSRKHVGIEGADNPLTEKWIEYFLTNSGKRALCDALVASEPYRPYIREQLAAKNMPSYLQYLPIVESNYRTTAVSRAGATGIWQFMTNSMAPFLKKNSWYDERRDPWKSTDAALAKLTDNYKMFGDWALAIGAYNCGAGAMKRALEKSKKKTFWYLAEKGLIRQQTAQYVPKLIAIADIIENAEYYGVIEIGIADKLIENVKFEGFDYVTVAGMYSLEQIAKLTAIPESEVELLNPELLKHCTPAREAYKLRVPKGKGPEVEQKLKKEGVAKDAITYTVKQGDSLWSISRKYGLSVEDLCSVNNIKENAILSIKQTLIIPIFKEE